MKSIQNPPCSDVALITPLPELTSCVALTQEHNGM